jgi:hypothetical protein
MSWKQLHGERILMAIRTDVNHPFDSAASGVCVDFDHLTVFAFEDPSDGYRSCCSEPLICSAPMYSFGCNPDYIRAPVLIREWSKTEYGGKADGIEVIDRRNGKTVFLLGTNYSDEYYPSFTCDWRPENLADNEGK